MLRKKSIKGSNEASSKELNKRVNLLSKKSPDSVRRDNSAILERNSSILEKNSVSELDPYANKDRKNVK